jgi:crotonobetainyl-CoA:carnitine CoA-transferase CaiB-like acyl-CoA transferase
MPEPMTALGDLTVVELGEGWGVPAAGRILAELGARVIKVEPPDGDCLRHDSIRAADGQSIAIHLTSAGKESLVLDPAHPATPARMARLLGRADVLLVDRTGLAALAAADAPWGGLEARWPHLIAVALTPFGLTGRWAEVPATDLTVQAAAGILEATGFKGAPPTRAGQPLAELTGSVFATVAALAALYCRDATGWGQRCDVAMRDCLIAYLTTHLPGYFLEGKPVERFGNHHPMVSPWNAYPAKDGWVIIASGNDQHWQALLKVAGREDLAGDPRYLTVAERVKRSDEVDAIVEAWTARFTVSEVVAALEAVRFPVSPIPTLAQALADPHLRARAMVIEKDGVPVLGSPLKLSRTPGRVRALAPGLGRDTSRLLAEFEQGVPPRSRPAAPPPSVAGPLAGLRILEIGAYTTGPYMARLLANLGAEVTKVEPPEGEPIRRWPPLKGGDSYIAHLNNCDKRSVTLNLKHPRGRELLLRLAARHDVLIENFSRGVLDRLGLGFGVLEESNPTLVLCSLNGYGQYGPYADKPAYDMVIQAMSGIMALTGAADGPPTRIGVSAMDCLGAFFGMIPILAAVHARRRLGRGQAIDVSMHDLGVWLTQEAWPETLTGQGRPRLGNRHPRKAPHDIYPTTDGWVAIEATDPASWRALATLVGRPVAATDPRWVTADARAADADVIDGWIREWTAGRGRASVTQACHEAGVPAAPVLDVPAVVHDPLTRERGMLYERPHPTWTTVRLTGAPVRLDRTPAGVRETLPSIGADNARVLAAIGVGEGALEELRAGGIV